MRHALFALALALASVAAPEALADSSECETTIVDDVGSYGIHVFGLYAWKVARAAHLARTAGREVRVRVGFIQNVNAYAVQQYAACPSWQGTLRRAPTLLIVGDGYTRTAKLFSGRRRDIRLARLWARIYRADLATLAREPHPDFAGDFARAVADLANALPHTTHVQHTGNTRARP